MDTTNYEQQQQQQPYHEFYTGARFITGLILYPIICVFGLTGNALILVVLAHKMALSSTDVLIGTLAISDAVKLISDLLYSATCATMEVNQEAGQSMFAYLYPYLNYIIPCLTITAGTGRPNAEASPSPTCTRTHTSCSTPPSVCLLG